MTTARKMAPLMDTDRQMPLGMDPSSVALVEFMEPSTSLGLAGRKQLPTRSNKRVTVRQEESSEWSRTNNRVTRRHGSEAAFLTSSTQNQSDRISGKHDHFPPPIDRSRAFYRNDQTNLQWCNPVVHHSVPTLFYCQECNCPIGEGLQFNEESPALTRVWTVANASLVTESNH